MTIWKTARRLSDEGAQQLRAFVREALQIAEDKGVEELLAFATSAVRDAANADEVLAEIRDDTDTHIQVLSGQDEARLTFLAVRRWFGWSSGKVLMLDIGGGSLEIAEGVDEEPDVAISLPLGASRLHPGLVQQRPAVRRRGAEAAQVRAGRDRPARRPGDAGRPAGPRGGHVQDVPAAGPDLRRRAVQRGPLRPAAAQPCRRDQAGREAGHDERGRARPAGRGIPRPRAAVRRRARSSPTRAMDLFGLEELFICPWALREGVILRRLDALAGG